MAKKVSSTIRDVAAKAGVHSSTVSRALRGDERISPEVRQKVKAVAESMGYKTHPLVGAWMAHRRSSVARASYPGLAYLVNFGSMEVWRTTPSLHRYYLGALGRAEELGYTLDPIQVGTGRGAMVRTDRILKARGIKGVIVGSYPTTHSHLRLDWSQYAAVAQGFTLMKPNLPRTCADYRGALLLALRHLRRLGHQRIGLVVHPTVDVRVDGLWSSAMFHFQNMVGLKVRNPILWWDEQAPEKLKRWCRSEKPDAIISQIHDLRSTLKQFGFDVPGDISLVNQDWHPEAKGMAGVDHLVEQSGAAAVDLLVSHLLHNRMAPEVKSMLLSTPGIWRSGPSVKRRGSPVPFAGLYPETRHYLLPPVDSAHSQ
jgi:LacI family transcriptional regulator